MCFDKQQRMLIHMSEKPSILITNSIFPEIIDNLSAYFNVTANQDNIPWSDIELLKNLQGKQGVLTGGTQRIDAPLLMKCPQLKICANMSVGYDNFDLPSMTSAGVLGTNAPNVLTETTADMGFALILAAARRISEAERYLRSGQWRHWSYNTLLGQDIYNSKLGIIGMGVIGRAIARRGAFGFNMSILYHNRRRLSPDMESNAGNARYVSKHELLKQADHVILTVPYTSETRHMIGAEELSIMKTTSTLVNIGRGSVVDDAALAKALRQGAIAAAGLDVFEGEPNISPDLLQCENIVMTPHIASASQKTRFAMIQLAADNIISYLIDGRAVTPLNPDVLKMT